MLDISDNIHRLCSKICSDLPLFSHIDMERVAIGVRQTRSNSPFAELAHVEALRHKDGRLIDDVNGEPLICQRLINNNTEYLYTIHFQLPRLYTWAKNYRLATVFHELWHISPKFNGYLRMFNHPNCFHGNPTLYDRFTTSLAFNWLSTKPDEEYYSFLFLSRKELVKRYGKIVGDYYTDAMCYPEWDPDPFVKHRKVTLKF